MTTLKLKLELSPNAVNVFIEEFQTLIHLTAIHYAKTGLSVSVSGGSADEVKEQSRKSFVSTVVKLVDDLYEVGFIELSKHDIDYLSELFDRIWYSAIRVAGDLAQSEGVIDKETAESLVASALGQAKGRGH